MEMSEKLDIVRADMSKVFGIPASQVNVWWDEESQEIRVEIGEDN